MDFQSYVKQGILDEVPNITVDYDKYISDLKKIDNVSIPKRKINPANNTLGWSNYSDKIAVMKSIELLLSRYKGDYDKTFECEPLIKKHQSRAEYLESIKAREAELDAMIEDEKSFLEQLNAERSKIQNENTISLSNLDYRIKESKEFDYLSG